MKSMTGFGKAIRETKAYQLDIEIKSVNQRFLDVQIRSPKILNFIENDFRQLIKQQLSRGRDRGICESSLYWQKRKADRHQLGID